MIIVTGDVERFVKISINIQNMHQQRDAVSHTTC